ADTLYRSARALFEPLHDAGPFRLIGTGLTGLVPAADADRAPDLLDQSAAKRSEVERATDKIRAKFGHDAIVKGRALR
ncbi:MAG: DNA polymerase IV, partial [Roseobacter sp.]|nr:DNA polymerase IV [Roseobacter sp.]